MCDPIGVWRNGDGEMEIVEGHGRVMALETLNADKAPIVSLDHLTDEERRAYTHVHNQTTLTSGFDEETLELDLKELDFDWEEFGFDLDDGAEDKTEVNDVEPLAEVEQRVQKGQVWLLGEHRLICGDSSDAEVYETLMRGCKADVVFTSPPYNSGGASLPTVSMQKGNVSKAEKFYTGYEDARDSQDYIDFAAGVLDLCFKHTDGYIFWNVNYNANSRYEYIAQIVDRLPFLIEQVAWEKTGAIPQKGTFARIWEPVYVFSTDKSNIPFEQSERNLWRISNLGANRVTDHKACFPVDLPLHGIELIPPKSGVVLEPFCGSGTTLIAAENAGRKCYAIELDPHYCDVVLDRWERLTGGKAVLESDGQQG